MYLLVNCHMHLEVSSRETFNLFETNLIACSPVAYPPLSLIMKLFFLDFKLVSEERVLETLKTCQPKSCELDPIPTSLLLECVDSLLPSLTYLINKSLQFGSCPSEYKASVVKLLLKKQNLDPKQLRDYRPVSNVPFSVEAVGKKKFSYLS